MSLATPFVQILSENFPIAFLLFVVFVASATALTLACVFIGAEQERRNRASGGAYRHRIHLPPDEFSVKQ
jgi:hypothetical protein